LKYRRGDIESVCEFLGQLGTQAALLEKLVKLGVRQHPGSVRLNFRAGLVELEMGSMNFGRMQRGKAYLETARKMAESSCEAEEASLLPQIQHALTMLNEMTSGRMGLPFFGNGPPEFPFPAVGGSLFDLLDGFADEEDDPDDDDYGSSAQPERRSPSQGGKPRTRKKR